MIDNEIKAHEKGAMSKRVCLAVSSSDMVTPNLQYIRLDEVRHKPFLVLVHR